MQSPKLPLRNPFGNKGTYGTLAIFGGIHDKQELMYGGTVLAAEAALRAGVGKVVLVMPDDLLQHAIDALPQVVGIPMSETFNTQANCLLFGPASGMDELRQKILGSLLASDVPLIVDGDGLNILAAHPEIWHQRKDVILTPHIVELDRLAKAFHLATDDDSQKSARMLSQKLGATVVLKSSSTVVFDNQQTWILDNPNPVLSAAGSGDVLAGIIASLIAQYYPKQLSLFECCQLGVSLHNCAAAQWREEHGDRGLIMSELLELIPQAVTKLQ